MCSVTDWVIESTFISVLAPGTVLDGRIFGMVADVEVVCKDGFHKCGDDFRISFVMGVPVWEWGSPLVRSKTWVEGVFDLFLGPTRGQGFGIVGSNCEWGSIARSK